MKIHTGMFLWTAFPSSQQALGPVGTSFLVFGHWTRLETKPASLATSPPRAPAGSAGDAAADGGDVDEEEEDDEDDEAAAYRRSHCHSPVGPRIRKVLSPDDMAFRRF